MIDAPADVPAAIKTEPEFMALQKGKTLKLEYQHLLDSIANNRRPSTDAEEALRVLRVLDPHSLPKA